MTRSRVLLIGWDAADWKVIRPLMAAGKMPNVERLVTGGVSGSITTLHPPLSPMLWTSIATGKRPFRHGIHGFSEPTPDGRGIRPITNLSRRCKALWNILSQNDVRSTVIGWWPSHPAEPIRGVMVSDLYPRARGLLDRGWPLPANTVHPAELTADLADRRIHPDQLTPADVESFIPLAREIDQDKDKRLALFLRTLAECRSIQSAALWLLEREPWDLFAVYFESVDHFCHGFMRYHPPRQPWISARDFELYHNVVSMAYQLHDQMLGELVQHAGDDATVMLISDHGFHADHLRPASIPDIPAGPAIEHRNYGIFALCGPGVRQNQTVHGVSVLDVTPTILHLFGLPAGEDMDGKVLSQVLIDPARVETVASWEEVSGADGRHPPGTQFDPVAAHEVLEQMIALGYIARPNPDAAQSVQATIDELRYNLAESYQDAGRHADACAILAQLHGARPEEERFAVRLFVSCQALGRREEMRRIVDELAARKAPVGEYLRAQLLIAEGRCTEALGALENVTETNVNQVTLFLETADLCVRLGHNGEARQNYEKALSIDPDNAHAPLGLCRLALRGRDYAAAASFALDAVHRDYQNPVAHYLLGRALAGVGQRDGAADAFRAAISLNPNFPEAHLRLAGLLEDWETARKHRRLARAMRAGKSESAAVTEGPGTGAITVEVKREELLPPSNECLIIVTGLPRSGTSLVMQMLAAGGVPVLTDDRREADEDNPRGYVEYEPVKKLLNDSKWLAEARGKAVKIVAPLMSAIPRGVPARVIVCQRDLDEVLDSQEKMLARRNQASLASAERRRTLRDEYVRTLCRLQSQLIARPQTETLVIDYACAVADSRATAERLGAFLGVPLEVREMAEAVDPGLHRNRR
jgi:predicted AlkP superfamily phosphohydrolase/phosphomutase/tetratricopeptide (TPR) repeat protein